MKFIAFLICMMGGKDMPIPIQRLVRTFGTYDAPTKQGHNISTELQDHYQRQSISEEQFSPKGKWQQSFLLIAGSLLPGGDGSPAGKQGICQLSTQWTTKQIRVGDDVLAVDIYIYIFFVSNKPKTAFKWLLDSLIQWTANTLKIIVYCQKVTSGARLAACRA